MTSEEIFNALAVPEGFPRDAMIAAGEHRETMIPVFLDLVHRLTRARPEAAADDDVAAFLFAFYLLGEWRDTQAYRPLARLLRRESELVELLLGDAITEGTSRVIAGVFDGDLEPIIEVIEDPRADMFVRVQMIDALVYIARDHPEMAPEVKRYLEAFHQADFEKPDHLLESWAFATAELGLTHLEPEVLRIYEDGLIPPESSTVDDFHRAIQDGGSVWLRTGHRARLIENAVEELSGWYCFTEAYAKERAKAQASRAALPHGFDDTFERAEPKVGRNDPCPCGSGKKFKKCCLH